MKKLQNNKKKTGMLVLFGAVLAGAIFLVFCALNGISPFGANSILRNDGIHQYAPFLAEYIQRIKTGGSLLFSWNTAGGINEFSTMCYYLLSPFNLFALPFSAANIDIALVLIVTIKVICAGATSTYYMIKKSGEAGLVSCAFAMLYTFGGFFISYYYNTMWLDAFIMLPLIALGIEKIVDGKKSTFYFFALLYTIAVNFYMGYMICVFAVLYFFVLLFSKDIQKNAASKDADESSVMSVIIKFGISSLFAGLISAVVIIPVLYAISASASKSDFQSTNAFFNILDFLSYHISGMEFYTMEIENDTAPYVACGLITLILAPLYFSVKSIKINERIAHGLLLIFMAFSFAIPVLNYFWHGLSKPTYLPYRFTYIYIFVLVCVAYKAYRHLTEVPVWAFVVSGAITATAIIYASFSQFSKHFTTKAIVLSAVAAVVYFAILILIRFNVLNKKVASVLLSVCIVAEIGFANYSNIRANVNIDEVYTDAEAVESVNQYISDNSNGAFARTEVIDSKKISDNTTTNYGALYNYNSLSTFSSLTDTYYSLVQRTLGNYGNSMNTYKYVNQTPVYNALFSLNYVYDMYGSVPADSPYYEKVDDFSDGTLYKVRYSLPLGYCVNNDISNWDPYNMSALMVQSTLWNKVTDSSETFNAVSTGAQSYNDCYAVNLSEVSQYLEEEDAKSAESGAQETTTAAAQEEHDHDHEDEVVLENATDLGAFSVDTMNELLDTIGEYYPIKATGNDVEVKFNCIVKEEGELFASIYCGCLNNLTVIREDGTSRELDVSDKRINDLGYFKAGETLSFVVSGLDREFSELNNNYPVTDIIQVSAATLDDAKFMEGYNAIQANGTLNIEQFEETYIKGTVNAANDSVMMMSMPYDTGWTVYIDGEPTELKEHSSHIMMFNMPAGEHTVEMKYFPQGLKEGLFVSGASILALLLFVLLGKVLKAKKEFISEEEQKVYVSKADAKENTSGADDKKDSGKEE